MYMSMLNEHVQYVLQYISRNVLIKKNQIHSRAWPWVGQSMGNSLSSVSVLLLSSVSGLEQSVEVASAWMNLYPNCQRTSCNGNRCHTEHDCHESRHGCRHSAAESIVPIAHLALQEAYLQHLQKFHSILLAIFCLANFVCTKEALSKNVAICKQLSQPKNYTLCAFIGWDLTIYDVAGEISQSRSVLHLLSRENIGRMRTAVFNARKIFLKRP